MRNLQYFILDYSEYVENRYLSHDRVSACPLQTQKLNFGFH
jgi:hypothetical protein